MLPDPPSGTGAGSTAVDLDLQQLERSFEEANQRLTRAITYIHELMTNNRAIDPDARSELASARSIVLKLAAEAQRMGSNIPAILRWAFVASKDLIWDDCIV
jgi:hypothetical protein